MSALDWQPWGKCGVQATMPDDNVAIVEGYESGNTGGFALTYRYATYRFSSRTDAYMAAELLATVLYLEQAL